MLTVTVNRSLFISDVFGKSASAITAKILATPTEKITDVSGFRTKGIKTTRTSRAGACIKPLLVQCALNATRAKQFPEVRSRCLALKKRRGHKKCIIAIAIARMHLTVICNMLKKNEPYNPERYHNSDRPPAHRIERFLLKKLSSSSNGRAIWWPLHQHRRL